MAREEYRSARLGRRGEVDGPPAAQYAELIESFAIVTSSQKGWHRVAQGQLHTTHQKKIIAGASTLVRREALTSSLSGPPHLVANIAVPTLQSSSRSVYLFPDRVLVRDGGRYAAITYEEIQAAAGNDRFIEDGHVASVATVVGTTWKYVNKKGGPDTRFNNNRQLPVAPYGQVTLTASSGMNTILSFSRLDAAPVLASAIFRMRAPDRIVPIQRPTPSAAVHSAPQRPVKEPAVQCVAP